MSKTNDRPVRTPSENVEFMANISKEIKAIEKEIKEKATPNQAS